MSQPGGVQTRRDAPGVWKDRTPATPRSLRKGGTREPEGTPSGSCRLSPSNQRREETNCLYADCIARLKNSTSNFTFCEIPGGGGACVIRATLPRASSSLAAAQGAEYLGTLKLFGLGISTGVQRAWVGGPRREFRFLPPGGLCRKAQGGLRLWFSRATNAHGRCPGGAWRWVRLSVKCVKYGQSPGRCHWLATQIRCET
jgi:hypothetical protein